MNTFCYSTTGLTTGKLASSILCSLRAVFAGMFFVSPISHICSYSQCSFWCDYSVSLIWNSLTKFSLLTGVHISQSLCIFELRGLPVSFAFLSSPAQMTSVASLEWRTCVQSSHKNQLDYVHKVLCFNKHFFLLRILFSRKTSLCRNTLLMYCVATNHPNSTYFYPTLHCAGISCLVSDSYPHLI